MKMQQMMECLLAKIDANQAEIKALKQKCTPTKQKEMQP
jgi:hypothetical protein